MKILKNIEKGNKAKFETLEDIFQTFFCIAGAVYQAASKDGDINQSGVLEMQATDKRGRIRVRVDYIKEEEKNEKEKI